MIWLLQTDGWLFIIAFSYLVKIFNECFCLIHADVQGSDNPIPLSPQWLLPKQGESKPGIGGVCYTLQYNYILIHFIHVPCLFVNALMSFFVCHSCCAFVMDTVNICFILCVLCKLLDFQFCFTY